MAYLDEQLKRSAKFLSHSQTKILELLPWIINPETFPGIQSEISSEP